MIVRYNIFGYLIGEGFSNVFKNKKSTGASLMIMCATMIIFGVIIRDDKKGGYDCEI